MQQHAAAFFGKRVRELSGDHLRGWAQLAPQHDDEVAFSLLDCITQRTQLAFFNSAFARYQRVLAIAGQRQYRCVARARANMHKLGCLLAQTNRNRIDDD